MEAVERNRLFNIARSAAQRGELDRAKIILERLLRECPEDIGALDLLGFVYFFQGRHEEGVELCRSSLNIKPESAYAHKGLGLHLARLGKLEEGLEAVREAIRIKPDWLDPRWDLAVTLFEHQRYEEARATILEAEALFPQIKARTEPFLAQIQAAQESLKSSTPV